MALITTAEAAKRLGLHRSRVYVFIHEGRLPAQKLGPYWVIEESALTLPAIVARNRKGGYPKGRRRGARAEPGPDAPLCSRCHERRAAHPPYCDDCWMYYQRERRAK